MAESEDYEIYEIQTLSREWLAYEEKLQREKSESQQQLQISKLEVELSGERTLKTKPEPELGSGSDEGSNSGSEFPQSVQMLSPRKNQKSMQQILQKKSFGLAGLRWLAFLFTSLSFLLKADDKNIKAVLKDIKQITFQGHNSQAAISNTADHLIFVSERRKAHFHKEVYLLELSSKKERRVTFQLGSILQPQLVDQNQISYISSTDEEKEFDDMEVPVQGLPRMEIYKSDLWGREITRLTTNPGYDGHLDPGNNTFRQSYALRWSQGVSQIVSINANELPKPIMSSTKSQFLNLQTQGEFLFWIEETSDLKQQSLYRVNLTKVGPNLKTKRKLIDFEGKVRRMSLIDNGRVVIFGLEHQDPDEALIVAANLESKCAFSLLSLFDKVQFGNAIAVDKQVLITYERKIRDDSHVFMASVATDLAVCQDAPVKGIVFR